MAVTSTYDLAATGAASAVNVTTAGLQYDVVTARLADGNVAAFWLDQGGGGRLMGRVLAPSGAPLGAEVVVATGLPVGTPGADGFLNDQAFEVAALANGSLAVTWRNGASPSALFSRVMSADLAAGTVPTDIGVGSGFTPGQGRLAPSVAALAGGGFVVAYQGAYSATDQDIIFARFDAAGTRVGEGRVDATAAYDELPSVAGLADGGFAIAFSRNDLAGGGPATGATSAWRAVYNANGSPRAAPGVFDATGTINRFVEAVALPGGGFAVSYQDSGWGTNEATSARFGAGGTLQGPLARLTNDGVTNLRPHAAVSPDGYLGVVTWNSGSVADTRDRFSLVGPDGVTNIFNLPLLQGAIVGAPGRLLSDLQWTGPGSLLLVETTFAAGNAYEVVAQAFDLRLTLRGDGAADTLDASLTPFLTTAFGGGGGDTILGSVRADALYGEAGDDLVIGGLGDDVLTGGAGLDSLYGAEGNDVLIDADGAASVMVGGLGNDQVYGGAGNDYCVGDEGDDTLVGGGGQDSLYGGLGNDYIVAGDGAGSVLDGGAGANTLYGAGGADYIVGGEGADLLVGSGGSDYEFGNAGDDTLYGGSGTDYLYTNAGNDFVWTDDVGLAQSTDYVYAGGGTGVDTVADFTPGTSPNADVLVISPASGIGSFAQAQAAMSQVGVYTVLTMSGGDAVYLYNVQPFQMTANNFLFF